MKNRAGNIFILLMSVFLCLNLTGCHKKIFQPLAANDVVLAFGDSLTAGAGTQKEFSYPAVLSTLISRQVINAGSNGELTSGGVLRLPGYLEKYHPAFVILCLGGNDLLKNREADKIIHNLGVMIHQVRAAKAQVVLLAVPKPGVFLSPAPLYEMVAKKFDVPVEMDLLTELLSNNQYKSDAIHLNKTGYRLLAEGIADWLQSLGAIE